MDQGGDSTIVGRDARQRGGYPDGLETRILGDIHAPRHSVFKMSFDGRLPEG